VLGIIVATIVAAVFGSIYGRIVGTAYGNDSWFNAGTLIGGASGFLTSSLAAAFLFTLSEIAANTRNILVLMQDVSGKKVTRDAHAEEPRFDKETDRRGSKKQFVSAQSELSEASLTILRKAREEGYELTFASEGMIAARLGGAQPIYFTSNWDIGDWARAKKWV